MRMRSWHGFLLRLIISRAFHPISLERKIISCSHSSSEDIPRLRDPALACTWIDIDR